MVWQRIALHMLYGVALYVMVWHSLAWFGCIDRIYIHTAAEIHVLGCLLEERFPCFTNQNQPHCGLKIHFP